MIGNPPVLTTVRNILTLPGLTRVAWAGTLSRSRCSQRHEAGGLVPQFADVVGHLAAQVLPQQCVQPHGQQRAPLGLTTVWTPLEAGTSQ